MLSSPASLFNETLILCKSDEKPLFKPELKFSKLDLELEILRLHFHENQQEAIVFDDK